MGFVDHGPGGTGGPVAALLRPGNAGSNTAADHITATRLALAQLPKEYRRGRRTLIRCDSAGGTHEFEGLSASPGPAPAGGGPGTSRRTGVLPAGCRYADASIP